jgi:ABC-type metal ion transport system substrate-binding protein
MSRAKIEAILDGLTLVVKELQDANARNATLTNYSLEVTEDIIRIFCPPAFQHQTYCNTGKKNENKLPMVLIDTKV